MKEEILDDQGTTQEQAHSLLNNLCEEGFDGDVEKLALALGRDVEEIDDIISGEAHIDEDLLMKIRGIAQKRGIEIE